LDEVRKMSPRVCALTAGQRPFQCAVLEAHGIRGKFDEVYGWDSMMVIDPDFIVPHYPNPILIDDQQPFCMLSVSKLNSMGVIDKLLLTTPEGHAMLEARINKTYVRVNGFQGDPLDSHLMGVLPELASKIAAL